MIRCLVLLLAALLSACQPADPAPADCGQPQTDQAVYFFGQYLDQAYLGSGDSLVCLNFTGGGYGLGSAWMIGRGPIITWNNETSFIFDGIRLPGTQGDSAPQIRIGFAFVPTGLSGQERPAALQVGRYDWAVAPWPEAGMDGGAAPYRSGVQVWLQRSFRLGGSRDNWFGYATDQDADSYFEVTSAVPDSRDERKVLVTGRFTVRLFGRGGRFGPSILLRNVQFRTYFDRPEVTFRQRP